LSRHYTTILCMQAKTVLETCLPEGGSSLVARQLHCDTALTC